MIWKSARASAAVFAPAEVNPVPGARLKARYDPDSGRICVWRLHEDWDGNYGHRPDWAEWSSFYWPNGAPKPR